MFITMQYDIRNHKVELILLDPTYSRKAREHFFHLIKSIKSEFYGQKKLHNSIFMATFEILPSQENIVCTAHQSD